MADSIFVPVLRKLKYIKLIKRTPLGISSILLHESSALYGNSCNICYYTVLFSLITSKRPTYVIFVQANPRLSDSLKFMEPKLMIHENRRRFRLFCDELFNIIAK